MKTISVSVSEEDYEAFREASELQQRSIAQLIREAMAHYREHKLRQRTRLDTLTVLVGHRPTGPVPGKHDIHADVFER